MGAREAIDELRRCRQLPRDLRLDSDCDRRVERVVRELMQTGAQELTELRRLGDPEDFDLLLHWSDRASSLAVRRGDADLLVGALFAFGFAESGDQAKWLQLQSQLRQAARAIGRDPEDVWAAAIGRSDDRGAAWLGVNRGRRRFIRRAPVATHYSDPYDGGRFRFGRPDRPSVRIPVLPAPGGVGARPDLSVCPALVGEPAVREALEALIGDLWREDRQDVADALLHAVLAHDDHVEALNELRATLSQTGIASGDSRLAAMLART